MTPPDSTNRQQFQDELEQLERQALGGLDLVCQALDRAIEVVQHQDVELASMVIADDDRIDGRYLEVHQGILSLLALQAPVAGDLRLVAALLHVIKHVERMGDQCVNMAKLVPLAGHHPPADDEILANIARMGELARSLVQQSKLAFAGRDAALALDLVRQDDEIDDLNRACCRRALEIGDDADRREWAMHMMLVARCLERIGDNAVDIGEQTAFVVTGLFREFEDASHPELTPPGARK
jgi:phosphate transport system protein